MKINELNDLQELKTNIELQEIYSLNTSLFVLNKNQSKPTPITEFFYKNGYSLINFFPAKQLHKNIIKICKLKLNPNELIFQVYDLKRNKIILFLMENKEK